MVIAKSTKYLTAKGKERKAGAKNYVGAIFMIAQGEHKVRPYSLFAIG